MCEGYLHARNVQGQQMGFSVLTQNPVNNMQEFKKEKEAADSGNLFFVEMGGFEPPSKQTIQRLSTRLSSLRFWSLSCRKAGHLRLILLILRRL